jgi:hypothetical protein
VAGGWVSLVGAAMLGVILIAVGSGSETKAARSTSITPVITMSKYEHLETGISYVITPQPDQVILRTASESSDNRETK